MKHCVAAIVFVAGLAGCSGLPHTSVNKRPIGTGPKGADLVDRCVYAVRFNLDEASVEEVDYLDAMYCFGVMDGILGANDLASARDKRPYFCLLAPMKPWVAAKVVIDYGKVRPDLLPLDEVSYAMLAMAASFPCADGAFRRSSGSSIY